jgi:DNA transposition AAA+ family ATPase
MNQNSKEQIAEQLKDFVGKKGGLNKASKILNISSATVSNMLAGKWEKISAEMWRGVETQLTKPADKGVKHAETEPFKVFSYFFNDAKKFGSVHAIASHPGSGKTYTLDYFKDNYSNVFYVKCLSFTSPRDFLTDLAKVMGLQVTSFRLSDLLRQISKALSKLENPLILIDEIEKTEGHKIFMLFIDLFNANYRKVGLVVLGTPGLIARINRFLDRRIGYNEFFSRVGGKVIIVPSPNQNDALLVAKVNGITDDETAYSIANDSETDLGYYDLRRVEKLIHSNKLKGAA